MENLTQSRKSVPRKSYNKRQAKVGFIFIDLICLSCGSNIDLSTIYLSVAEW